MRCPRINHPVCSQLPLKEMRIRSGFSSAAAVAAGTGCAGATAVEADEELVVLARRTDLPSPVLSRSCEPGVTGEISQLTTARRRRGMQMDWSLPEVRRRGGAEIVSELAREGMRRAQTWRE
ncbi:hypothetical protein BDZ85DRAFT_261023 [Elsinoe ampelina]|uniref:Uncharacterized protein n=1 Tax=Elsinoe ampelina TaxID=302913 RepID=A0A6A6GFG5_9PEZI|nr:hypothetical protein BDZ85DRAFT_261023 [Elsinoe ampelina]